LFVKYGGNPVSLAVASAVLDVIEKDKLQDHAARVGKVLLTGLESMKLKYKFIGDVRGVGLFIGVDVVKSPLTKEASAEIADYVVRRLKEERIIMSTEGKYGNVLKFKPPMLFNAANAQYLLHKLDQIFAEVDSFLMNHSTISSSGSVGWEDDSSSDSSADSYYAAL
jgi:4-aminobutyrate aminotransferase-like enzyme